MRCAFCNSDIPDDTRYCPRCGGPTQLAPATPPPAPDCPSTLDEQPALGDQARWPGIVLIIVTLALLIIDIFNEYVVNITDVFTAVAGDAASLLWMFVATLPTIVALGIIAVRQIMAAQRQQRANAPYAGEVLIGAACLVFAVYALLRTAYDLLNTVYSSNELGGFDNWANLIEPMLALGVGILLIIASIVRRHLGERSGLVLAAGVLYTLRVVAVQLFYYLVKPTLVAASSSMSNSTLAVMALANGLYSFGSLLLEAATLILIGCALIPKRQIDAPGVAPGVLPKGGSE